MALAFGPFILDPEKRLLLNAGVAVPLGPKVVETLCVLVESHGELVAKDELMNRLWPNQHVEESNISQNIYRLRRVLAGGGLHSVIVTMACRGYKFVAPITDSKKEVQRESHVTLLTRGRQGKIRRWAAIAAALLFVFMILAPTKRYAAPSAFSRLSLESQRLYGLGLYHWNLRSDRREIQLSLRYFGEVVRRDPNNPLGYVGLADAYLSIFDNDCSSSIVDCRRVVVLASTNALRAVQVDPQSAEAHTSLAMTINEFSSDDSRSDAEFLRAIALDKSYALAHHWYGNLLNVRGFFAEAIAQHKIALSLEPASPSTYAWLAEDAFFTRKYNDAVAYAHESLAIYPLRHATQVLLGLAYHKLGRDKAALACFNQLNRVEREALVAALYAGHGHNAKAIAALRSIGQREAVMTGSTASVALAWIALGDKSRAYSFMRATPLLNRVERNFLARDPRLDMVRSDPRFRRWTTPG